VVIGDGPLFAPEVVRLMSDEACLVWSNALGTGAPFYVPTGVLVDAMMSASGREWNVIESEAHWGTWAVLRPASR
jgi:hypothetical protein